MCVISQADVIVTFLLLAAGRNVKSGPKVQKFPPGCWRGAKRRVGPREETLSEGEIFHFTTHGKL